MSDFFVLTSATPDYEFTNFSFNGIHSSQYNLTAAVSGLTEESLTPFEDKIVDIQGRDGAYYFGTHYKSREFTIICAFDSLTSANYRSIVQWLNPKTTGRLIFDERPFKYYVAKLSSAPRFSYVPFEEPVTNGKQHIFKGELILNFIATDPFAYSDYILLNQVPIWNGTDLTTSKPYNSTNLPGWYLESGMLLTIGTNYTPGATIASVTGVSFYNAGTVEVFPKITLTISAYSTASGDLVISAGAGNTITVGSLQEITGTDDTGAWTLIFEPGKGLATATTTDADYSGTTYNLGSVHTGTFLHLNPGANTLTVSKAFTNIKLEYSHRYL